MEPRILVTGRAGTGKTGRVVEELRALVGSHERAGRFARFQVLVPTYSRAEHLKRQVLRGGGLEGMFDRGIGTFEQLAERVTGLRLSKLAPHAVCDALLAASLEEEDVPTFRRVSRFRGFRGSLLRVFKEVKAAETEPGAGAVLAAAQRLLAAGAALPGARGERLVGVARVLARYQQRLEASGWLDHEDLLRALLEGLRGGAGGSLAFFALDGFVDLTEVQERIVHQLAKRADRCLVTLLCDPDEPEHGPLRSAALLRRRLLGGVGFEEMRAAGNLRAAGDLARLERSLAGEVVEPAPADGSVRFLAGADPADEADRVARTCLRWAAEGIPRSEILVVVRSVDSGAGARVLDALRRHAVPHRRISGRPTATVPAVRAALRMLRLLGGVGDEEALDAIHCGCARGVDPAESDALQEVARVRGLSTTAPLAELADELSLETCAAWLARLAAVKPRASSREAAVVRGELLAALGELLAPSFEGQAVPEVRAAEDAAALRRIAVLSASVAAGLRAGGRSEVTASAFVRALEDAVADDTFTVRDLSVDRVNVVDAEEARQWEARAVIVAGLRTGEFPGGAREDLLVSDADREDVSRRTGVRLPGRIDRALERERMLFYSAVTRATERLVLVAAVHDERGDPALRSPFLDGALAILPPDERVLEGAGRAPGDLEPAQGETFHRDDLLRVAVGALTERTTRAGDGRRRADAGLVLLRDLVPGGVDVLREAGRWFSPEPARLAADGAARVRLAAKARRSASSLADFVQCPYRHFARTALRLRESEAAADEGLDSLGAGMLVHEALKECVQEGAVDPAAAVAVFERVWERHAGRFAPSLALARTRRDLRRVVLRFLDWESQRPLGEGFRPVHTEMPFGLQGAEPLVIAGRDGPVELCGMIDRVDADGAGHAVVLDYKLSSAAAYGKFAQRMDSHEDLQLPLYALAVEQLLRRDVVAVGYLLLREDPPLLRMLRLAPSGPESQADWCGRRDAELDAVRELVLTLDGSIRSGEVEARPLQEERCGPGRCPYADLCRFEGEAEQ